MKLKAKNFRIPRRINPARGVGGSVAGQVQKQLTRAAVKGATAAVVGVTKQAMAKREQTPQEKLFEQPEDGFGDQIFPTAAAADQNQQTSGQEAPSEFGEDAVAAITTIKAEGLTGRQLRMARRTAQKHGLNPSSDYDAVYLLRRQGIDPFKRSNMLELVTDKARGDQPNLPMQVAQPQVPVQQGQPGPITPEQRASEIRRIQRDIAKRRKRSMYALFARLGFFIGLPTAIAGYYYTSIATPLYSSKTEFVIQQAESARPSPTAGLFSGTGFATSQDSIIVQGYLTSREAMKRLNDDLGFKPHYQNPTIDPIQRLSAGATDEDAYKIYKKKVKIGYDPTEGVIRMEVIAVDPEAAVNFSNSLIGYAEERVDEITQRVREDHMAGARESYDQAEVNLKDAQMQVIELQEEQGILSGEAEGSIVMGEIQSLEGEKSTARLQLAELRSNPRPNETRVRVLEQRIENIDRRVAEARTELSEGRGGNASLPRIQGELMVAQANLETRQMMLQSALEQMETSRIEANRQTRYLSVAVTPVRPDKATYPRAFENTMLAFLIFAGIYLLASLTASILREQVSS